MTVHTEFLAEVARLAAPEGMSVEQVAEIVKPEVVAANAGRIYEWLAEVGFESDTVAREAVFEYAAACLGVSYEVFYDAWLAEVPVEVAPKPVSTESVSPVPAVHPKTGRPVAQPTTFEVGDLVTEHINSDGYPGVVVAVSPSGKTVWVSGVDFLGNFSANDVPGYNGYGDSGSIVVDPESIERAFAAGKDAATKYVVRIASQPQRGSLNDEREFGGTHHSSGWRRAGGYGSLSKGASYRQDPHF